MIVLDVLIIYYAPAPFHHVLYTFRLSGHLPFMIMMNDENSFFDKIVCYSIFMSLHFHSKFHFGQCEVTLTYAFEQQKRAKCEGCWNWETPNNRLRIYRITSLALNERRLHIFNVHNFTIIIFIFMESRKCVEAVVVVQI